MTSHSDADTPPNLAQGVHQAVSGAPIRDMDTELRRPQTTPALKPDGPPRSPDPRPCRGIRGDQRGLHEHPAGPPVGSMRPALVLLSGQPAPGPGTRRPGTGSGAATEAKCPAVPIKTADEPNDFPPDAA
jgi:hypothetical protein